MRRIGRLVLATFLVSLSLAAAGSAAVSPASGELPMGGPPPTERQRTPSAVYLGDRAIVAWEDTAGVFARFHDSSGAATGPAVQLAASDPMPEVPFDAVLTLHKQPKLAVRGDGFLLVWVEQRMRIRSYFFREERIIQSSRIMARLFDGNAVPRGRASELAFAARADLTRPAVTADAQGYWVAWQQTGGEGKGIHLRQVSDSGRPGTRLAVSSSGTRPALAVSGNRILVAWEQMDGVLQVFACIIGTNGNPATGVMQLTDAVLQAEQAAVVAGRDGEFLVAWQHSPDGRHAHIYGQILSRGGGFLGPVLDFSTGVSGDQGAPRLAILPDGGYLVSWVLWFGTFSSAVQAAAFDGLGNASGDVVRVSLGPVTGPWSVALAAGPGGKVLAVWEGGNESKRLALRGRLLQSSP